MVHDKINHPYLTAIKRTDLSLPVRYLLQYDLLKGRVLDFGCGFGYDTDELKRRGYDITGYDYYYRPEYPEGKFDTIVCVYVLNVLENKQFDCAVMSIRYGDDISFYARSFLITEVDVLEGDDFFPEQPFRSRIVKLIKKQNKSFPWTGRGGSAGADEQGR